MRQVEIMRKKLLMVQVAALGENLRKAHPSLFDGQWSAMKTIFPAVTCPVQASFRTGLPVSGHGMVANGLYWPDLEKVMFWEQSSRLVEGTRIWESFRESGGSVGIYFWQQSLGESVDQLISPAPIHKHGGGMIQSLYSQPTGLGQAMSDWVGRPFNLMHYWGPLASERSSEWIVRGLIAGLSKRALPDLVLAYLPHLDYGLQKRGPLHVGTGAEVERVLVWLKELEEAAAEAGYAFLAYGDYAIESVTGGVVYPNRLLREAGLLKTRSVRGMAYLDYYRSEAFAMVDHQIAHVFCRNKRAEDRVREIFGKREGVARILDGEAQEEMGVAHRRAGQLMLEAAEGWWLAYPWFADRSEAPDFATHVDIHNKPGFDPAELFFGWPPLSVSLDAGRVRGTHGRSGAGLEVLWRSNLELERVPGGVLELARAVGWYLGTAGGPHATAQRVRH